MRISEFLLRVVVIGAGLDWRRAGYSRSTAPSPTDAMAAAPPLSAMEAFRIRRALAAKPARRPRLSTRSNTPPKRAMRWRSGNSARMYAEGDGVTQDDLKAFRIFPRHRRHACRRQSGHAAIALRRQCLRRARPLLSRRHPEDRDQARSRPRTRDVRLCRLVFPRSGSAILSRAALSRRRRRAARPTPGRALVRPRRRRRASASRRPCWAPCCLPAITCRARPRAD